MIPSGEGARSHCGCDSSSQLSPRSGFVQPFHRTDSHRGTGVCGSCQTLGFMKTRLIRSSVQFTLAVLAFFARRPWLKPIANALTRSLAVATIHTKRIGRADSVADLGPLWQRSFPSRKQVPIHSITEDTVYAEIHTPCPLRGTGDVHACYRMMEFDRTVLRHAGGQFVVLQSQASPGVSHCRVAMRLNGSSLEGLVAAHEPTDANPALVRARCARRTPSR